MSPSQEPLKAGVDFYLDEQGRYVFTAEYHKRRGYCCQNGCRHCPYGFKSQPDQEEPEEG